MRRMVHAYMKMKSRRSLQNSVAHPRRMPVFFSPRAVALALVVALFASSAGISYAAENALPGDVLYGIKVNVNEPLQGALNTSSSGKAAWAIRVAGERVKEAAALAASGRLSTSTQNELQQNFEDHAQVAVQAIQAEASTSPEFGAEAAASFQAQLDEYSRILKDVGVATGVDTKTLAASARHESGRFASIRAQADGAMAAASTTTGVAMAMAAARTGQSAQAQLDASFGLAQSASHALATSSLSQVVAQLDAASTSLSNGEKLLETNSPEQALGAFQSVLAATQKLGVFLETSAAIHSHTGLIIGEPGGGASSSATTSVSGMRKKDDGRYILIAATTTTAVATSAAMEPQSTTSSASSSSSNQTQDTKSDGSAQHAGIPPMLPISVPVDTVVPIPKARGE